MASVISHIFSSSALVSLGLYNLICTTRNHLKSPSTYSAKPYHPLALSSSPHIKQLPLYLLLIFLLISVIYQTLISTYSDPLLKGQTPVHLFTSLQFSAVLFLFFLLALSLISSSTTPPSDLFFALTASAFFLQFSVSSASASVQISDLQAKCDSVFARLSLLSSLLCLTLAAAPKLFVADVGLWASICLQGLWVLQTGLSLYVEGFIPEGCHRLLDVVSGVEGSTKCDLEESKLRAVAILDLVFVIHVMFVAVIVMAAYAVVARTIGVRRVASYEALSTSESGLVQLKTLSGTQA